MSKNNVEILKRANAAVSQGDNEGFLEFCTGDTKWVFVGDQVLKGKEAVRRYISEAYIDAPNFNIKKTIAEGDFVTVLGEISMKNEDGQTVDYSYCDVWQFRNGKMAELTAFVIESKF